MDGELDTPELVVREIAGITVNEAKKSIGMDQVVLTLALALTFATFCGSIGYTFVYDDHAQIMTNSFIHSWRYAPRYFTQHVWESIMPGAVSNYYRPIFILWLRINHMLFGLRAWGWHLTSILVHLGVTLTVYFLALRLIGERLTAAFAALIFGVHPVHVEGVVWVSGVTEPSLAILFISSFLCYLKMREGGKRVSWWTAGSFLLFVTAMFAKETGVIFPAFIFAYEWLFWHKPETTISASAQRQRFLNAVRCALPYAVLTPLYLVPRVIVLKGLSHTLAPLPLSTKIATMPGLLWFYLKRLVWPVNMSLAYSAPYVRHPGFVNLVLPSAALAATTFVLWVWARRPPTGSLRGWHGSKSRAIAFASFWILMPILPVLDVSVLPLNDCVHDRYMYLPSVGFAMIAALALRSIRIGRATVYGQPAIQFVLAATVAGLFVWGGVLESIIWSDDLLLYHRGASVSPDNPSLKSNLANALAERGHYKEAEAIFRQVLIRKPNLWEANYNLGLIYYKFGRLAEAENCFKRSIVVDPTKPASFLYLGLTELKLGHLEEAAAEIHQSVRMNPDAYGVHFARGMVLKLEGDLPGAVEEFKEELALNPEQDIARDQIAEIEGRLRRR